jgi:hypothetical protein
MLLLPLVMCCGMIRGGGTSAMERKKREWSGGAGVECRGLGNNCKSPFLEGYMGIWGAKIHFCPRNM